ncbi:MAG: alanine racemase [Rhodobacteraceae bacterium]|nr:alanine racemase [Paracoccaceae bacterium]
MGTGTLTIDLDALAANWRALDALSASTVETAATVKANGYGLDAGRVARALAGAGARRFFVAVAEEGASVRAALGPGPEVFVYSGHMEGDAEHLRAHDLIPMLNSVEQVTRHFEALPGHPFGMQLDTGMNRLGIEAADWSALRDSVLAKGPVLVMSHLACSDDPDHPMNAQQLRAFQAMVGDLSVPRSIAATGGVLLGAEYHFEVTRPGIGLYGGLPFEAARPVVRLSLPVIQLRDLTPGETVGYGNSWTTDAPARIATVSGGYADGILRAISNKAVLYAGDIPCPLAGRVSMDLLTIDVTHLSEAPEALDLLCEQQTVDDIADIAGTIGYEILTSLGTRYDRTYIGVSA